MDEKVIRTTVLLGRSITSATVLAVNVELIPVLVSDNGLSSVYISDKILKRNVTFIVFLCGRKAKKGCLVWYNDNVSVR